ncbi:hypothetical protein Cgig2_025247 [Carnegiea gigantea]|uniref:Uncharacterized protein n=1 Tax=Carnegiea gigantea TaxID=171969 RepID=A0A9Q1JIK2_9CARY|nr:hypothetical protein Cgig2_025247 [Carnegiea gigantea]
MEERSSQHSGLKQLIHSFREASCPERRPNCCRTAEESHTTSANRDSLSPMLANMPPCSLNMDNGSQSETIGTPTPLTDASPSPPPPVSSAARRPLRRPHGRGGRSSFAEVNEQIDEVDPSDFPIASRATKLESSFAIAMVLEDSDSDGQAISEVIDLETESDVGMEAL